MDRLMKQIKNVSSEISKRSRTTRSDQFKVYNSKKDSIEMMVHRLTHTSSGVDQPCPSTPPSLPSPLPPLSPLPSPRSLPSPLLSPPSPPLPPSPRAPFSPQSSPPLSPSPRAPLSPQPSPLFLPSLPCLKEQESPISLPCLEEQESLGVHFENSLNDDLFCGLSPFLPPIRTRPLQQDENISLPFVANAPSSILGCPNSPGDLYFPAMQRYQQEEYVPWPVLANAPSMQLSPDYLSSQSRVQDWLNSPDNLHSQPFIPDQQEENVLHPVPTNGTFINLDELYFVPSPSGNLDWPSHEDVQSSPLYSPTMSDWSNSLDGPHAPSMVLSSLLSSPTRVFDWPDSEDDLDSPTMLLSPNLLPSSPTTGLITNFN